LKLYEYAASANCLKVRLMLRQLEIEFERVEVDILAGDSKTDEFLALNPAGRTPVLVLDDGQPLAESAAILLYLAEGTPFLPSERLERARVHQWLFFEQNLLEPNVGTARFWKLTGRASRQPEVIEQKVEAGRDALGVLERRLAGRSFLAADGYTVADLALYGYTHVAHEAGIDMSGFPAIAGWIVRVEAQSGFVNDLEPYPARRE
jgi:glutathione S-transferase